MIAAKPHRILLSTTGLDPSRWLEEFSRQTSREVVEEPDGANDPSIRFAVVWKQRSGVLARLPNLRAVFSIGAGVDHLFGDTQIPQVPIVRVVADDLTLRMSEYVVWQVLDHLRQGWIYRDQQARKIWREPWQPAASDLTIGIMGLGVLGSDAGKKLKALGFNVTGWSRRGKHVDGIAGFHGAAQLPAFVGGCDMLVVLLPLTPATRGIISKDLLGHLKPATPIGGAVLINAGRGGLQVDADIMRALESGALMAASLDVFEIEPLPRDSGLWSHPRVTITPHAAATSDPARLVPIMVRQMDEFDAGMPLENLVDRATQY